MVPFLVMQDQESLAPTQFSEQEPSVEASPSGPSAPPSAQTEHTEPSEEATEPTAPAAGLREEESWFDDALFIGDSWMVGLSMYARLGEADYFAGVGLSVFQLFSQTASDTYFGETDLESLLCSREYGKIYIMLGLNEAGYDLDSLKERYRQDVERIQEPQPDAVIYLLQVYGVSGEKAKATDYLRPERLGKSMPTFRACVTASRFAAWIRGLLYEDDEGYLRGDYSADGASLW